MVLQRNHHHHHRALYDFDLFHVHLLYDRHIALCKSMCVCIYVCTYVRRPTECCCHRGSSYYWNKRYVVIRVPENEQNSLKLLHSERIPGGNFLH